MTDTTVRPIFEIGPDTHVDTMWTCNIRDGDVAGMILQQPGADWEVIVRFRHYADQRVANGDDEKTIIGGAIPPDTAIEDFRVIAKQCIEEAVKCLDAGPITDHFINARGLEAGNAIILAMGRRATVVGIV